MEDFKDVKIVSCNKGMPKSDWYCINMYPEGILSNGLRFRDVGEVTEIYNDNGYLKTLYFNSDVKKDLKLQYTNWETPTYSKEQCNKISKMMVVISEERKHWNGRDRVFFDRLLSVS